MLLFLLLLLAAIALGLGFVVKWMFIVAAVIAVIWLISLVANGGFGRRANTLP